MNLKRFIVLGLDAGAIVAGFVLAFLLRFDFQLAPKFQDLLWRSLPLAAGIQLSAFFWFNLYRGIARYASFADLVNITKAVACGALLSMTAVLFVHHGDFPRSVLVNFPVLTFLSVCSVRFGIRLFKSFWPAAPRGGVRPRALIVGAGDLGESVLRQIRETGAYAAAGFIDDDPAKWRMRIHGVPVLGGREALSEALLRDRVDVVVVAVASRRGDVVRSAMEAIRASGRQVELKVAPSLQEALAAPGLSLRKVRPADLLNRKTVSLDQARIGREFSGKTVLVTGAGGTIGAELCRQLLPYGPKKLVLLDNHATALFYRELELKGGAAEIVPVLGDVRDRALLDRCFNAHRPQAVLHAAAHKHLPQLESNAQEGVTNNVLGTHAVADAARRFGAESFLLISTDKAVRPSSVMGATKRAAELSALAFNGMSPTRFMAVRFGNVLGSSGSVLRLFEEQIAAGGPVTITHPDATRYFMTVEESAQLILQAVSMGRGGEIFVLNMGAPVRILDMAKNLILLSGTDEERVPIRFTGLRPGEKLHEELFEEARRKLSTGHPDIFMSLEEGADFERMSEELRALKGLAASDDPAALLRRLSVFIAAGTPAPVDRAIDLALS